MSETGISASKQSAPAVISEVAAGNDYVVTDRGRPVAQLVPLRKSKHETLSEAGLARPAQSNQENFRQHSPEPYPGSSLSEKLREIREDERY